MIKFLSLSDIRIDGGTQPRYEIDSSLVSEYAEEMKKTEPESKFPPVIVFFDGAHYWLADGFHRYHAEKLIGSSGIQCDIREGTVRDAILYSVGANIEHGKRRTNEDKRKAVLTLLKDEIWKKWSDGEIARKCGVGQPFASTLRRSLNSELSDLEATAKESAPKQSPQIRTTYVSKSGKVTTMNTSNIGKRQNQTRKDIVRSNSFNRVREFIEGTLYANRDGMERILSTRERGYPPDIRVAIESASAEQIKTWIKILDSIVTWSRKMKTELQKGEHDNAQG